VVKNCLARGLERSRSEAKTGVPSSKAGSTSRFNILEPLGCLVILKNMDNLETLSLHAAIRIYQMVIMRKIGNMRIMRCLHHSI
jgi:hypothetical protein